jgi:hypothetical protein
MADVVPQPNLLKRHAGKLTAGGTGISAAAVAWMFWTFQPAKDANRAQDRLHAEIKETHEAAEKAVQSARDDLQAQILAQYGEIHSDIQALSARIDRVLEAKKAKASDGTDVVSVPATRAGGG